MGITSPQGLLFHLPIRYQDRTKITPIFELRHGRESVVVAQIDAAEVRFGRRRNLLVSISDHSGSALLRFFHFSKNQQNGFSKGAWIVCFGEARQGIKSMELVHPEYRLYTSKPDQVTQQSLTPVYPTTEGIGHRTIRKLVNQSLAGFLKDSSDYIPQALSQEFGLMPLPQALKYCHNPPCNADTDALQAGIHPSQQRLALEEMLAHYLALSGLRQSRKSITAPQISSAGKLWKNLSSNLKFQLTNAQNRVIEEIKYDLSQKYPAVRLIQGDVGCGKTIVSAAAALEVIENNYQVVLMAPTELLAEQHRKSFADWFKPLHIEVEWLTGRLSTTDKKEALARIENGAAKMVVGTHALFQDVVKFQRLGLIIVDEQHKFGVDQRLALRNKGFSNHTVPHQIIMSATPIPRSMAMILYADLDVSSIDEMPPGRKAVTTVVVPDSRRNEVAIRIKDNCQKGQQAYWVCPLIEESEKLQAQAATNTYKQLKTRLPGLQIELIHGRLKSEIKDSIMTRFSEGKIDLLVATTVIEVGVDVVNANLMVIENAERLGLAQLHQLRGRVGRDSSQSSCVLMYQPPLSNFARDRLAILRDTTDGFKIAQKDLEQRGPGELLGKRQTGIHKMRIANISRDNGLIPKVEQLAGEIRASHSDIIPNIIERWIDKSNQYANV